MKHCRPQIILVAAALALSLAVSADEAQEYYDSHVHLTNYVQEGLTARQYLDAVGGLWCTNIGLGRREMALAMAGGMPAWEFETSVSIKDKKYTTFAAIKTAD